MSFTSLEPEERRWLLRDIGKNAGLNILIETGTNEGKTPYELKGDFKQIFTIELDPQLHQNAVQLFRNVANVECLPGDSTYILPLILERITEPALVWLDGHYSGPGTAHGAKSSPICEELQILFNDGRPHVILVDDARIFDGGPEHLLYPHYASYPPLTWVEDFAAGYGYHYELRDDIIRLTP